MNLATDPKDNKKGKEKDTKDKKTPRPYVRKGRGDRGVDKAEDVGEKKRAKRGSAQTFARRYPPSDASLLVRFNAIRDTFNRQIGSLLFCQSAFQDGIVTSYKGGSNHHFNFCV